jgi:hypothetical protein
MKTNLSVATIAGLCVSLIQLHVVAVYPFDFMHQGGRYIFSPMSDAMLVAPIILPPELGPDGGGAHLAVGFTINLCRSDTTPTPIAIFERRYAGLSRIAERAWFVARISATILSSIEPKSSHDR